MRITVILAFIACLKAILAYQVFIDQAKGQCEAACLYNQSQTTPCCSLNYIASEFGSNTSNLTIHLPQKIRVNQLLLFQNVSLLSIVGYSTQKTILNCSSPKRTQSKPSGLRFVNVTLLKISNVIIENCEAEHFSVNGSAINASLAVVNCSNVELVNAEVRKNFAATAIFIENTCGNVSLTNISVLKHGSSKRVEPATSYAKGVFIYSNTSVTQTNYIIKNGRFFEIKTWKYKSYDVRNVKDVNDWLGYGLGGGLSIVFDRNSSQNNVSVINCTFKDNFAPWGAGMYIRFETNSSFNSVSIVNSWFENCSAGVAGGGLGICLIKRVYNGNTVYVHNTTFKENSAEYGAGTYMCALHSNERKKDIFATFSNCSWIENRGRYSPAVDIAPTRFDQQRSGVLPNTVFENCNFFRNKITFYRSRDNTSFVSSGVFVITKFTVTFSGNLHFDSNFYTALLLNSGKVVLQNNVSILFINNTGFRGGAISLNGFSFISIEDNCKVNFSNNRATEYGGAIFYYPIEQREFFEGRVCFLKYIGNRSKPVERRNISFVFSGNTASISGSAIYSTSLFSCYYSYRGNIRGHRAYEFFKDIGNFTFDSTRIGKFLGTAENYFLKMNGTNQVLFTRPGQRLSLPITVWDELQQYVKSEFFVRVKKLNNTKIFINSPYTINRTVIVCGTPNESATIVISSQHIYRSIQYEMDITLLSCPPGYYHDISKLSCECSYRNESKFYIGIKKCNDKNFTAVIQKGYWAGYHNKSDELFTAPCPFQFCILNTRLESQHSLPNSRQALNSFMCGSTRRGVLCGKCEDGFSTFYHSRTFSCGSSKLCSYGIILFIVSEIFPVLVFFTIVIIFDVSFSSGARNGFIFFSQMVTILPSEFITINNGHFHEYLTVGYTRIYGIFNIDFFSIESLSFCLFSDAKVMDALAFKYITSVFALVLVLLLTIGINYCNCCDRLCVALKKKVTTKKSVLNGLSAFLVISYAECVRVSFFILRRNVLKGEGGAFGPYVAFYGGINYFEGRHLLYAIPAILTLGTIGFLPPMLLLVYPSTLKVLRLCKLSEHRLVLSTLRVTRINSLMPMFDVFQGCFKDHFRFFAGLYFFYRAALLVPYSFSQNLFECAVFTELVLALILGIHSTVHPYKENKYNIVDSLLLCNLAIINGISIFLKLKISETQDSFEKSVPLKIILYIQLLFIYLPVFIVGIYLTKKLFKHCQRKPVNDQTNDETDLLDYLEYRKEGVDSDDDSGPTI